MFEGSWFSMALFLFKRPFDAFRSAARHGSIRAFCGACFSSWASRQRAPGRWLPAESGLFGKKSCVSSEKKAATYALRAPGAKTDFFGTFPAKIRELRSGNGPDTVSASRKQRAWSGRMFSAGERLPECFLSGRWPEPRPGVFEQEKRRVAERKGPRAGWRHDGLLRGRGERAQGRTRSCAFFPAWRRAGWPGLRGFFRGTGKGRRRAGSRGLCA